MGALAMRERPTLRAFLRLGRACPVEFRLGLCAPEFLRQELREEHSRFTRRRFLARQLSGGLYETGNLKRQVLSLPRKSRLCV